MVHREYVNLLLAHDSVNDSIRSKDDLADRGIGVFRNCPSRLWKVLEPIDSVEKTPDDDVGIVWRIDFDECVNCREISLCALRSEERRHARKRFLTSS